MKSLKKTFVKFFFVVLAMLLLVGVPDVNLVIFVPTFIITFILSMLLDLFIQD